MSDKMTPPLRPPSAPGPGPNPLFFGVIVAICVGAVAGAFAGDSKIAQSNVIFRLAVGGAALAAAYAVLVILWLAWHRRTLRKLSIGPASGEAPSPDTKEELDRADDIQEFMKTATDAVEDLDERLQKQEERNDET